MPNTEQMLNQRMSRIPLSPILFEAGNPKTIAINRQYPIQKLFCRLTGSITVATANGTINPNLAGAMNLIKSLSIKADGKETLVDLPGFMLQQITNVHEQHTLPATQVTSGNIATYNFDIPFVINHDVGPNFGSLLNAPQMGNLNMLVQWGNASDVITAGGGGTVTVSSATQIYIDVVAPAYSGADQTVIPGNRVPYMEHLMSSEDFAVDKATAAHQVDLQKNEFYRRFYFHVYSNNVPSDDVLKSVKLLSGRNILNEISIETMQVQNAGDYGWTSRQTGFYIFDLARFGVGREPRIEDMVLVSGTLPFQLNLELLNPATDHIYITSERFVVPAA